LVDGEGGDVNKHWFRLRDCLVEGAETVCGRTKGGQKRHETRFWGEEIDKLVKDKRQKFLTPHHTGHKSDQQAYAEAKRVLKKAVTKAKDAERLDL